MTDEADRIGAVNTLAMRSSRSGIGEQAANTDIGGALGAIESRFGLRADWKPEMKVLILGAGGVARAVLFALIDQGADVRIANRTLERAQRLSAEIGGAVVRWEDRGQVAVDLLINCTSLGQTPDVDVSPWPSPRFPGRPVVFDTVYNPIETRLLKDARRDGCGVISGIEMFSRQAALQHQLWTGESHADSYQRAVERAVGKGRLHEGCDSSEPGP